MTTTARIFKRKKYAVEPELLRLGPLYDEIACALYNTTPENLSWQQRYKARSELYRRASVIASSVSWQSRQALQSISK